MPVAQDSTIAHFPITAKPGGGGMGMGEVWCARDTKLDRDAWHERAIGAMERGQLSPLIDLRLETKAIERIAERLRETADRALHVLSHYTTEPAAKRRAQRYQRAGEVRAGLEATQSGRMRRAIRR